MRIPRMFNSLLVWTSVILTLTLLCAQLLPFFYTEGRPVVDMFAGMESTVMSIRYNQRVMTPSDFQAYLSELSQGSKLDIVDLMDPEKLDPVPEFLLEGRVALSSMARKENSLCLLFEEGKQRWVCFDDVVPAIGPVGFFALHLLSGVVLSIVASIVFLSLLNRPLRKMVRAIETFGDEGMREDVPEMGPNEFRTLGRAFNRMNRRVRGLLEDKSLALATLTHDMRAPLTRMNFVIEALRREKDTEELDGMSQNVDDMNQIITDFMESFYKRDCDSWFSVDLNRVVAEVVGRFDATPEHQLRFVPSNISMVFGNESLLKRAVSNVIDNALIHGRGIVLVSTTATEDRAIITVRNCSDSLESSSVDTEDFELGYGLIIVNSAVKAHQGRLCVNRDSAGAVETRIELPLVQP